MLTYFRSVIGMVPFVFDSIGKSGICY